MARRRRVELVTVRRRLELLLKALYGRQFSILADPTPTPKWWERLFSDVRSATRSPEPVPPVDAERIVLPVQLPESAEASAGERYRILALAGAERLVRGSLEALAQADTSLERELFWIREGVQVDAAIAARMPALLPALRRARARLRASRPPERSLTQRERVIEQLVRDALRADPAGIPDVFSSGGSALASLDWARSRARRLDTLPRGFGGTAPVGHWGVYPREPIVRPDPNPMSLGAASALGSFESDVPGDDGTADESRSDPDGRSPSEGMSDDGRASVSTAGIGDAYDSNRRYPRRRGTPHRYAEWDGDRHRYVADAVTVWTEEAPAAPEVRAPSAESALMSRRLRSQFEQLRVQRLTSRRQFSGDTLDLAALTDALVDRRIGRSPEERVYERTQTNRSTLAIAVLVDVSGSTGNQLEDGARIIDLERHALFMALDALEAVGDPFGMYAFAGLGAHDVQVWPLKNFDERSGATRARIHALQPDQNTRLGAAIRHVARLLSGQPASHQLLLVITDGRPNDVSYHEEYAVADTRRAVLDARNQGTTVFSLAIDFENHEYLGEIFGAGGYVYVRDPHSLGRQLVRSIASMLRA